VKGVETSLWAVDSGIQIPVGTFSTKKLSRPAVGFTPPPIQRVPDFFAGDKATARDVEVNNQWNCACWLHDFMAWMRTNLPLLYLYAAL